MSGNTINIYNNCDGDSTHVEPTPTPSSGNKAPLNLSAGECQLFGVVTQGVIAATGSLGYDFDHLGEVIFAARTQPNLWAIIKGAYASAGAAYGIPLNFSTPDQLVATLAKCGLVPDTIVAIGANRKALTTYCETLLAVAIGIISSGAFPNFKNFGQVVAEAQTNPTFWAGVRAAFAVYLLDFERPQDLVAAFGRCGINLNIVTAVAANN